MKTLIKNATVLTMDANNTIYNNGYVVIDDEKIGMVGEGTPTGDFDIIKDANGGIVMPGMVNTHSHIPMIPFRSMGDDCDDRLRKFIFPLENDGMTPQLVNTASRYAVCELLLGGVTTITDMYYFEDEVASACKNMGIRAVLGETIINQPTCDAQTPSDSLKYCENFIKKWKGDSLITPAVAPHAPDTNTTVDLKSAKALADSFGVKLMMHCSEFSYEMEKFATEYSMTPVEYLDSIGLLDENTILAHCIHVNDADIDIIKSNNAKIAHCILANTKSGKGVSPIYTAMQKGVDIGLGSDGPSSGNTIDLFSGMHVIPMFQKTKYNNRSIMTAKEVVSLATKGGAKILGLDDKIGTIETGKQADIILIETQSVNMFPIYNPYSAIVYSANRSNVDSVWVNGVQLVENKKLTRTELSAERENLYADMGMFMSQAEKYKDYI